MSDSKSRPSISDDEILSLWRTVRPSATQDAAMTYQSGPCDVTCPTFELWRLVELAIEYAQRPGLLRSVVDGDFCEWQYGYRCFLHQNGRCTAGDLLCNHRAAFQRRRSASAGQKGNMKTHGVYRESVKDYRAQAESRMNDAQRAYNALRDKSTTYANEIAKLLALHVRVVDVWRTAPDVGQEVTQ